jgi:hypothetical protein
MSSLFLDELHAAAGGRPVVNPACPESHRAIVQRVIDRMPQEYWRLPRTGDVMPSLEVFEAHIRAFSFCEGFNVVKEGGEVHSGLVFVSSVSITASGLRILVG